MSIALCCAAVGDFVLFAGAVMKVPVRRKRKRMKERDTVNEREKENERSSRK